MSGAAERDSRFAAVFFDLDGTLVSERVGVREARLAVGRELVDRGLTSAAPDTFVSAVEQVITDILRENDGQWPSWLNIGAWMSRALERIDCPLDEQGADFAELSAIYAHERIERAAAIPGAAEAVAAARRHGPVGLITNFSDGALQRRKIAAAGLEGQFDAVFISGEVGVHKPDPQIFHHAAEALDAAAADCVHIGNSWVSDVEGALAAGMPAVWVEETPSGANPPPNPRVVRLPDLPAVAAWLDSG